jgi:predicted permease
MSLLPRDFRRRHGEEIMQLAAHYAEGRGWLGRSWVWLRAAVDLVVVSASGRGSLTESVRRDLGTGVRSLSRDPGFALFAIGIVGLGVGASVTVFSVARALLLRPLPFTEPERLVWVSNGEFGRGQELSSISVQSGQLEPLREVATQFTDVGGYHLFDRDGDHTLQIGDVPERATRLRVTPNFFDVLGVSPLEGRFFVPDELTDDGPGVVVLTYGGWLRFFGGSRSAVGESVVLDGATATVVGVLPPSFDFTEIFAPGRSVDYVSPFPLTEGSNRTGNTLGLIGRLAPGASIASAQAEAEALVRNDLTNEFDPVVRPLRDHLSGGFRPALSLLAASVFLVMLMVCANLSNLLLARGAARRQELSIRSAIGAGRGRLVRHLLTENLLLGLGGSALGVALAFWGTRQLASLDLPIPMLGQTRVDGTALALAVAAAVAVALLFGMVPALRATHADPGAALNEGARGSSDGRGATNLRHGLVVSQVAMACLLLVVSTLTARSLGQLAGTDLGYDPEGRIALRVDPSTRFADNASRLGYYSGILTRARATPGLNEVGLSDVLPMAFNRRWGFSVVGGSGEDRIYPYVRIVSDGYVGAMGLSLVRGRDLTADDDGASVRVALINDVLAERVWGGVDPLGAAFETSGQEYEVVGVVRATRQLSVDQAPGPEIFLPIRQVGDHSAVHMLIQGDRPPEDLAALARGAVREVDPSVPLDQVVTVESVVGATLSPRRFLVGLLAGFAFFALILAALGIYAVIAYSVSRRRREIGIHIALGATNQLVVGRMVRESLALTTVGLAVGIGASFLAAGILESQLFGIQATDPATLGGVAVLLTLVGALASWIPARRALAVSPVEAVRGGGGSGQG